MVEKIEGAEMACKNCGTKLVCHKKIYKGSGDFPDKEVMQWQNPDGNAHYSTKDGKEFTCNIPEGAKQTPLPENQTTMDNSQNISNERIFEKQQLILDCIACMFRIFVDVQLTKKENLPDSIKKLLGETLD